MNGQELKKAMEKRWAEGSIESPNRPVQWYEENHFLRARNVPIWRKRKDKFNYYDRNAA